MDRQEPQGKRMDRSTLLALFGRRPGPKGVLVAVGAAAPRSPDAVYQAARATRVRINAALAASRLDLPVEGLPR